MKGKILICFYIGINIFMCLLNEYFYLFGAHYKFSLLAAWFSLATAIYMILDVRDWWKYL